MLELGEIASEWGSYSKAKKLYSISSSGTFSSVKYAQRFEAKLKFLELSVSHLVTVVTIDSYRGTQQLKTKLCEMQREMSLQGRSMSVIDGNIIQLKVTLHNMELQQRNSELRIEELVKEAVKRTPLEGTNLAEMKLYFEVMQEKLGNNEAQLNLLVNQVEQLLLQQQVCLIISLKYIFFCCLCYFFLTYVS